MQTAAVAKPDDFEHDGLSEPILSSPKHTALELLARVEPVAKVRKAFPKSRLASAVEEVDPSIPIFAATLDRELNTQRYILPGVGDYGDRLYGT